MSTTETPNPTISFEASFPTNLVDASLDVVTDGTFSVLNVSIWVLLFLTVLELTEDSVGLFAEFEDLDASLLAVNDILSRCFLFQIRISTIYIKFTEFTIEECVLLQHKLFSFSP